ncbi:MAG: ATP-binding protein involved in chromosome partitioning [Myxococcota bacterium]|jgi:ATP-binding protein involved in chromosome partitioning
MADITKEMVLNALKGVIDPDLNRDIVSLDFVNAERVTIEGSTVKATVVLTTPACPVKEQLQAQCVALIEALDGVEKADVTMTANTASSRGSGDDARGERLKSVKNIIAVGSGKGGVGKSTVAANMAWALRQTGATVGILDADIYGPSLPILLGLQGQSPLMTAEQKIKPLEKYGMKAISMGFLLKDTDAVVWRGPMLGKALQQFIEDVDWGELDYLVIDLPPGTGDVQLSLAQLIPVDGSVIVTTPQDVAFADVRRAIRMFQMTKVPILGLVENMSYFLCPDNGKKYAIFGEGRTEKHAEDHKLDFLGRLPLDMKVGPAADRGELIGIADPDGEQAAIYKELAGRVAAELSKRHMAKERKGSMAGFFKVVPG